MSKFSKIKSQHLISRSSLIDDLNTRTKSELINDLLIELDAKNQAYYFILENGYTNQFYEHCCKSRSLIREN